MFRANCSAGQAPPISGVSKGSSPRSCPLKGAGAQTTCCGHVAAAEDPESTAEAAGRKKKPEIHQFEKDGPRHSGDSADVRRPRSQGLSDGGRLLRSRDTADGGLQAEGHVRQRVAGVLRLGRHGMTVRRPPRLAHTPAARAYRRLSIYCLLLLRLTSSVS